MFPEIFCISPSMASKRDDLPQPTCPTIIVSWPVREEGIYKLLIYQMLMEKHLILHIWCNFVPWGIRISMLDNAGGPSGVQVKNPFVIYAKMERNKKQKTSFRADFFFRHQRHFFCFHYTEHRNRVRLCPVQETGLQVTDFVKACVLMCKNLWTQTSTTMRKLWKIPEEKGVAV